MGSHAGAWEPGKNQHQKSVNQEMKDAKILMRSGGVEAIPMYIYSTNWISINVGYVLLQDDLTGMDF